MKKGVVTVVLPVYNVEKYLNRCIKSVVNQSYKNLEIILVDDGSPDGCPKLCDKWALYFLLKPNLQIKIHIYFAILFIQGCKTMSTC